MMTAWTLPQALLCAKAAALAGRRLYGLRRRLTTANQLGPQGCDSFAWASRRKPLRLGECGQGGRCVRPRYGKRGQLAVKMSQQLIQRMAIY